jgi:hypothetical protein
MRAPERRRASRLIMRVRGGCRCIDHSPCILGIEGGQIEKSRNTIHIQREHLARAACQADADHCRSREPFIVLPNRERETGEQIVLAENDVWSSVSRGIDRTFNSYDAFSSKPERSEIPADVLGHKLVTPHAESVERRFLMAHENIVGTCTNSDKPLNSRCPTRRTPRVDTRGRWLTETRVREARISSAISAKKKPRVSNEARGFWCLSS